MRLDDAPNVFDGQVCLARDLLLRIAPSLHAFYVMQQIDRPMLAPGNVLDQAHDKAIFVGCLDRRGRESRLDRGPVCFQPALPADQIESLAVGAGLRMTVIGRLRPSWPMFRTMPSKTLRLRARGLIHRDLVERDLLDLRCGLPASSSQASQCAPARPSRRVGQACRSGRSRGPAHCVRLAELAARAGRCVAGCSSPGLAWFSRSIRRATMTSGDKPVSNRICHRKVPAAVSWHRAMQRATVNSSLTVSSSLRWSCATRPPMCAMLDDGFGDDVRQQGREAARLISI